MPSKLVHLVLRSITSKINSQVRSIGRFPTKLALRDCRTGNSDYTEMSIDETILCSPMPELKSFQQDVMQPLEDELSRILFICSPVHIHNRLQQQEQKQHLPQSLAPSIYPTNTSVIAYRRRINWDERALAIYT